MVCRGSPDLGEMAPGGIRQGFVGEEAYGLRHDMGGRESWGTEDWGTGGTVLSKVKRTGEWGV